MTRTSEPLDFLAQHLLHKNAATFFTPTLKMA
jgi:hypothetical protein